MKKIIKYFFITLATLFILAVVLFFIILLILSSGVDDSNIKKELATNAIGQITSFYDKNGYYPKSLHDIPLYANKEFVIYVQNHTFSYSSFRGDTPKYIFSWRGGAMGWTGNRCTNDKSELSQKQDGVIRTYHMPGGTVCTVTDLH